MRLKKNHIPQPHWFWDGMWWQSGWSESTILNNGTLLQLLRRETVWLLNSSYHNTEAGYNAATPEESNTEKWRKANPADIISICGLHHVCYQVILFACSVKMCMVPLMFFPLPGWHHVELGQQRAWERHCRGPWSFASWFLCVGPAGSCSRHLCQHPALPVHTWLPQCPTASALTVSSACTLTRIFSGQLLLSAPWQAVFVVKCLQGDTSPWIIWHPGVRVSQKFLKENIQKILPVQQHSDCLTMQWGRTEASPTRSGSQPRRWASPWVLNLTLEL